MISDQITADREWLESTGVFKPADAREIFWSDEHPIVVDLFAGTLWVFRHFVTCDPTREDVRLLFRALRVDFKGG